MHWAGVERVHSSLWGCLHRDGWAAPLCVPACIACGIRSQARARHKIIIARLPFRHSSELSSLPCIIEIVICSHIRTRCAYRAVIFSIMSLVSSISAIVVSLVFIIAAVALLAAIEKAMTAMVVTATDDDPQQHHWYYGACN